MTAFQKQTAKRMRKVFAESKFKFYGCRRKNYLALANREITGWDERKHYLIPLAEHEGRCPGSMQNHGWEYFPASGRRFADQVF